MPNRMASAQLAHVWVAGTQREGWNSNQSMSFNDDVLRSYYTPIAARVTRKGKGIAYLVSSRDYSVTTRKHISCVRRAIPSDATVFHVSHVAPGGQNGSSEYTPTMMLANYHDRITELAGKAKRARQNKPYLTERHLALVAEANRFARYYGIRGGYSAKTLARLATNARLARENRLAAEVARDAEVQARELAEWPALATDWRNGDQSVSLYRFRTVPTLLRLSANGQNIETSRGAEVPLRAAERIFHMWLAQTPVAGERVGAFTANGATADTITIGCHVITREEAQLLATALGWTT